MEETKLGDSYDIVKRFWGTTLRPVATLYAHDRFIAPTLRPQYSTITTIPVFDTNRIPQRPFGLLLDPDNGVPLPNAKGQKVSRRLAPLDFIIREFSELKPHFVVWI